MKAAAALLLTTTPAITASATSAVNVLSLASLGRKSLMDRNKLSLNRPLLLALDAWVCLRIYRASGTISRRLGLQKVPLVRGLSLIASYKRSEDSSATQQTCSWTFLR